MANFAVIEDGLVVNVIVADSVEVAQEVTGNICVEYTDEKPAGINWTWDGSDFIKPKPFPSWILTADKDWDAPVAMPDDGKAYVWNEETMSWDLIPTPEVQE